MSRIEYVEERVKEYLKGRRNVLEEGFDNEYTLNCEVKKHLNMDLNCKNFNFRHKFELDYKSMENGMIESWLAIYDQKNKLPLSESSFLSRLYYNQLFQERPLNDIEMNEYLKLEWKMILEDNYNGTNNVDDQLKEQLSGGYTPNQELVEKVKEFQLETLADKVFQSEENTIIILNGRKEEQIKEIVSMEEDVDKITFKLNMMEKEEIL